MAVSSQGMQDHFGAKSANWLTNWLTNYRTCQPRFQCHRAKPGRTLEQGCDELGSKTNAIKASTDTLDQLMAYG